MAVSVDRVYQTVLAIANKEQRGYITPQEFNLFANHAQNEIFEQYFYDLNQFRRIPGNSTVTSDPRDIIEEKISFFKVNPSSENISVDQNGYVNLSGISNLHKLETVCVSYNTVVSSSGYGSPGTHSDGYVVAEELNSAAEMKSYMSSRIAGPTFSRPVFVRSGGQYGTLDIKPAPAKVKIDYIRKPHPPNWTYIIANNKALWNPAGLDMRHFELHPSEEKNLVVKILLLAGISVKDNTVASFAAQKEASTIQQEKS